MFVGFNSNFSAIADYLNEQLLNEEFKNSNDYKNYIKNKKFNYELVSGNIDISSFTNTSITYTFNQFIYKATSDSDSNVVISTIVNGELVLSEGINEVYNKNPNIIPVHI